MAFQIKDFTSIVASMINYIRGTSSQLTDFAVGAVNRTMLEAPAIEIDELYQQMFNGLQEAIPAAIYPPFGFSPLQPTSAVTNLTFSVPVAPSGSGILIPAGTVCSVPGNTTVTYATLTAATIAVGTTSIIVAAQANTPGSVGNVAAGTITSISNPISGVSVTNAQAVITGTDLETDQARAQRFQAYIAGIARSNVAGIQYGATLGNVTDGTGTIIESVFAANVVEPFLTDSTKPIGYIDVYIWNGVDSASTALVNAVTAVLEGSYDVNGNPIAGYKAAGVVVTVYPVTEQYQNVTCALTLAANAVLSTIATQVQQVLASYIAQIPVGGSFIMAEAYALVMGIAGVENVSFSSPTADVVVAPETKLLSGTFTVT